MSENVAFVKGNLYVRTFDGKFSQLFIALEDVPTTYTSFSKQVIVEYKSSQMQPQNAAYSEFAHQNEVIPSGGRINFLHATKRALHLVFSNWNKDKSVLEWINEIEENGILDPEELAQLKHISKMYNIGKK